MQLYEGQGKGQSPGAERVQLPPSSACGYDNTNVAKPSVLGAESRYGKAAEWLSVGRLRK